MNCNLRLFGSPLGWILAAVEDDGALIRLEFVGPRQIERMIERLQQSGYALNWNAMALGDVVIQVSEYFARKRREFDLKVRLSGTVFQETVWKELTKIPFGETVSYRDYLAIRIGEPGACRAVGRANGANPVSLIIPCHRVIGANQQLRGYGGGVDVKRGLLALEGSLPWPQQFLCAMSQQPRGEL